MGVGEIDYRGLLAELVLCLAEVLQHAEKKGCSEPDTSLFFPAVFVMEARGRIQSRIF